MMTRDQAMRKVLRCLRLAQSSNPNEAATALRQARALMDEYGVTEDDARAAEYSEARTKPCARGASVPASLAMLMNLVADGFRCEVVCARQRRQWNGPVSISVAFIGRGADPTVAAYAFDVLRMQMDRDRKHHIGRVRKRANREARGEAFARGWVHAVAELFPSAELSEEESNALQIAKAQKYPDLVQATPREMGKGGRSSDDDYWNGIEAGRQAKLHKGVSGEGQRRLGQSS